MLTSFDYFSSFCFQHPKLPLQIVRYETKASDNNANVMNFEVKKNWKILSTGIQRPWRTRLQQLLVFSRNNSGNGKKPGFGLAVFSHKFSTIEWRKTPDLETSIKNGKPMIANKNTQNDILKVWMMYVCCVWLCTVHRSVVSGDVLCVVCSVTDCERCM